MLHGSYAAGRSAARALGWWLGDAAAAGLFAAGLAIALGAPGGTAAGALAMAAGGVLRAGIQVAAADAGAARADAMKAAVRARLLPRLFLTALRRGRPVGEDMRLATDTVEALHGLEARFVPLRRAAALAPLLVAGLVALASPVAAAILVATLFPFGIAMALAGSAAAAAARAELQALTRLSGLFVDRLRHLPDIRLLGAERGVARQIGAATALAAERSLNILKIAFVSSGILEFFAALAVALVAVYCGFHLLGVLPFRVPERLGLAAALFALAMAPEFYLPMRRLAGAYHDRQRGEAAAADIAAAAGAPVAVPASTDRFTGLVVHRAAVRHASGTMIGPVSLTIGRAGLVALTGPSGSGKSTILHAIAGLLPLESGQIGWAAGAPARIGWAGQQVLILPGTLASAIALGRPDADADAIAAAAAAAGLTELVRARGLDLRLDHLGSGLSGGERRRVGLARAILSGRPLVLLDEPTADLDPATAHRVRDTIAGLAGDRAVLVATHDPVLAAMAAQQVALG